MAYDEDLAYRLRDLVAHEPGFSEKKMFGGLAFMINGHMAVAASREGGLLLRVNPEETEKLLRDKHARPFEMRGRSADGWLRIIPEGTTSDDELERWVAIGVGSAKALPPKR